MNNIIVHVKGNTFTVLNTLKENPNTAPLTSLSTSQMNANLYGKRTPSEAHSENPHRAPVDYSLRISCKIASVDNVADSEKEDNFLVVETMA